jgi:YD repeat-containing protein
MLAFLGYANTAFPTDSVDYNYDENGRLIQAFYQSGHSYHYVYDKAGNIVNIQQGAQADQDGDFLPDHREKADACPFIDDADSDDDGIPDGLEDKNRNGIVDPGETDPCNPDTDGDGIQDGTELGYTTPVPDPDGPGPMKGTDIAIFQPDLDPATTTNPLLKDTDGDGIDDGVEDANRNGRVDAGESSPSIVLTRSIRGTLYEAGGAPFTTPVTLKAYSGASCSTLQIEASTRSAPGTGAYAFEDLIRDHYYILAEPSGIDVLPQWYSTAGSAYTCLDAQPVSLAAIPDATGKDIHLTPAASISGTVLDSSGAVMDAAGIYVKVHADNACTGTLVKTAPLNPANGRFSIQGLSTGTYYLQVDTGVSGYQSEWWASGGDASACSSAEAITVAPGGHIDAIDIRLDQGGGIGGTLYKSNGTTIITGETILVEAYAANACSQDPAASAFADEATGIYFITGLKPGTYYLKARTLGAAYIDEWWSAAGNAFNCLQAGGVTLTAIENISSINFQLDAGGIISGTVYESDGVTPVTTPLIIEFYQYQTTSSTGSCGTPLVTYTNQAGDGSYRQALPAGKYYMQVNPTGTPYAFAWWAGTGGALSCEDAIYVTVQAGVEASGKDYKLQPGATISGHIYQDDGVTPIAAPIQIIAYSKDPCNLREITRGSYNAETGQYIIDNLANGAVTVLVKGEGTSYADEWWSTNGNAYFCFQAIHHQIVNNQDISDRDILLDVGATISGTVYKKDGLTPVDQAVPIGIYPENACGSYRKITTALSDPVTGQYAFARQGPGNYALLADLASGALYFDEWWSQNGNAFTCQDADVFTLSPGADQTHKDFQLDTKSTISGTLYKPDGATMNVSFSVHLYGADACQPTIASTVPSNRKSGTFSFTGVKPGRYHLLVNTNYNVYASEWWSAAGDAFACAAASEIVVPSGENVTGLEIRLNTGAKVAGALYKEDGITPISENTQVRLYRGDPCNPESVTFETTSSGTYEIDALQPGTYYMKTVMSYYFDRWWSPSGDAQTCEDAQPILIAQVGDIITATDFRLKEKGSFSGKVYQLDGSTPVTGTMRVYLYRFNPSGNPINVSYTAVSADGSYHIRGLDAGTYLLRAYYNTSNFAAEWWTAGGGTFYWTEAEGIVLTDGQQIGDIHFSLHEKGRITGTILKNDGSVISPQTIYVYLYAGTGACTADQAGSAAASVTDGSYVISGVEPGTYFLRTDPLSEPYISEWWSSSGHTYDCSEAQSITAAMDQTVSEKDFRLYECPDFPDRALNDHFENATDLSGSAGTRKTTNYCATAEDGEPDHAGYGDGARASLWWRWTAPTDGIASFKTENSSFDTVLAVYMGESLETLTLVAQNDNMERWNSSSQVSFEAQEGQTYYIALDTADGLMGSVTLTYGKDQILPGDVNGDGVVDLRDAILILQILAKLANTGSDAGADVNADGRIGMAEAIFILQKAAEIR